MKTLEITPITTRPNDLPDGSVELAGEELEERKELLQIKKTGVNQEELEDKLLDIFAEEEVDGIIAEFKESGVTQQVIEVYKDNVNIIDEINELISEYN